MKNTYVTLTLFFLLLLSQNNLYSFEKNSILDEKLIGVYKSKNTQKMFFLREESARSKNINGVDFLEINFPDKTKIFKYKIDNKKTNIK
ncbi:MAG: hypothetical protein Q9M43_13990 [Sulfurimonas sp.]|nr:hypothetical protein [Sulfurimonas sp.]